MFEKSVFLQIQKITKALNDDSYQAEWKDRLIKNHKDSYIKESYNGVRQNPVRKELTGSSIILK